jgi:hypothetical protein
MTYPAAASDSSSVIFTLPANRLPIGVNAVTVSYTGDTNYASSSSAPVLVTVTSSTQGGSSTSLNLSSATVALGASYTFTAAVTPTFPVPTGTITFASDGQLVTTPVTLLSGTATVFSPNIAITPGTHQITAIYSGDSNHQSSVSAASSFTLSPGTLPTTTTIAINSSTVTQGAGITVVAAISPVTPTPTGTLQLILDGNLYGGPVALTGASTSLPLLTSTLQSGAHILSVFYSGDSAHQANTSAPAAFTIMDAVGGFTLSPSTASTTAVQGRASSPVTLTATTTGGFHSPITFACTGGLPGGAVCVFTPSSVTPTGVAPATTRLTISPAAVGVQSSAAPASRVPRVFSSKAGAASGLGVTLAGLLFVFLPRRTRRWSVFTLFFALSTLGMLSGCGSGGVDPNGLSPSSLSAGSYAVNVTATGGSVIQTATINLTIQ